MTPTAAQIFEAHHQQLRDAALRDPRRLSLTNSPRACWYRRSGHEWRLGLALAWDGQADFTGAIIETAEGLVLTVPIERIRFQPPVLVQAVVP